MKLHLHLLALAGVCLLPFPVVAGEGEPKPPAAPAEPPPVNPAGLKLAVHYQDGLTARSGGEPRRLAFMWHGCHFSLLFTNTTGEEMHLWKPHCPPGDLGLRFEFKTDEKSPNIEVARTSHAYTAGMGLSKTITLLPGDSLVRQVDFASYWSVPFKLKAEERRSFLMRAVYESALDPRADPKVAPHAGKVWQGRLETPWERVTITNVTDSPKPGK
jgi:hypothetical protein